MAKKKKTTKKQTKKTVKKVVAKKNTTKKVVKKAMTVKPNAKKSLTKKTTSTNLKKNESSSIDLVGTTLSSFSVLNSKGESLTQQSFKGHKVVLYFYPKDDTPGCTLEGQEFSSLSDKFKSANTVVFGVSKDSVKSHDKFICKYDFKIDLISDENEQLCKIFDVIKEKNMYGRTYMGIERSTFVIDENLKIVKEMRKVSPAGHAQEILEFIKSL